MKILYIESRRKLNREEVSIDVSKLPKELFLAYSIQYQLLAEKIKEKLEKEKIKIKGFQQVLGCSKLNLAKNLPVLLIGSGRFHALNLALQGYEVYIYNNSMVSKITAEDTEKLKESKKIALNKFLNSENLGIIVSTKPGQSNLKLAEELKKKIKVKFPAKHVNFFISNNININEFENFGIDSWINTSCPGLINDSYKIINADDILSFLNEKH